MKGFTLPQSFLLGSATAATQIEGGDYNSNWYYWSRRGMIKNGESSIVAADHWNRYREDIELMKELNQEIYRMSIEWSRIEPEEGKWSLSGIGHYRDELQRLINAGIKPLITLHHFSHPLWLEELGAWTNRDVVFYFTRFAERIVKEFGDLISEYCTINEPNVFANDTYMDGKFPPGDNNNTMAYFKASKNMILAHLKTYKLIHQLRENMGYNDTKVGIAMHMAIFDVMGNNPFTKLSKSMMDFSFHKIFLRGMIEGKLSFPIGLGYPEGRGVFCDFMGINYYSRHIIHPVLNPASLFGEVRVTDGLPDNKKNDLGWEIYPEGLYEILKANYSEYELPIYITENGIPDMEDNKRWKFICEHLYQVSRLIEDGVDVRRYYHWSLMDNLEWNDGYGPRFGLIEINYETLERRVRDSARLYADLCKHKTYRVGAHNDKITI